MRPRWMTALALMSLLLPVAGCNLCENEYNGERPSPSGRLRAVAFTRDCGATTGFSTQVSILKAGQSLSNEGGNVFTADATGGLYLDWNSDRELVISYPRGLRTFRKTTEYEGVIIQYKEMPQLPK